MILDLNERSGIPSSSTYASRQISKPKAAAAKVDDTKVEDKKADEVKVDTSLITDKKIMKAILLSIINA